MSSGLLYFWVLFFSFGLERGERGWGGSIWCSSQVLLKLLYMVMAAGSKKEVVLFTRYSWAWECGCLIDGGRDGWMGCRQDGFDSISFRRGAECLEPFRLRTEWQCVWLTQLALGILGVWDVVSFVPEV